MVKENRVTDKLIKKGSNKITSNSYKNKKITIIILLKEIFNVFKLRVLNPHSKMMYFLFASKKKELKKNNLLKNQNKITGIKNKKIKLKNIKLPIIL